MAVINPAVDMLPPITLAVALTKPPVNKLAPVMLPLAVNMLPTLLNVNPALAPRISPVSLN